MNNNNEHKIVGERKGFESLLSKVLSCVWEWDMKEEKTFILDACCYVLTIVNKHHTKKYDNNKFKHNIEVKLSFGFR